jgi:hypothetical protein
MAYNCIEISPKIICTDNNNKNKIKDYHCNVITIVIVIIIAVALVSPPLCWPSFCALFESSSLHCRAARKKCDYHENFTTSHFHHHCPHTISLHFQSVLIEGVINSRTILCWMDLRSYIHPKCYYYSAAFITATTMKIKQKQWHQQQWGQQNTEIAQEQQQQ